MTHEINDERHVSPGGELALVVVVEEDDITIGFEGHFWHTHGDILAELEKAWGGVPDSTPETATRRFVDSILANQAIIEVIRLDGIVRSAAVIDDLDSAKKHVQPDEDVTFRHWDGTVIERIVAEDV